MNKIIVFNSFTTIVDAVIPEKQNTRLADDLKASSLSICAQDRGICLKISESRE